MGATARELLNFCHTESHLFIASTVFVFGIDTACAHADCVLPGEI
jgi:hypothetical protein